ncbi:MAG: hypothetical protein JNM38_24530 [Acidobacteria bacterium]|nr:hypothetical protein [Acidobacteriota bacterium]
MRQQHLFGRIARPALALAIAVASVSCGDVVRQGRGSSYLIIDRLEAARGGTASEEFDGVLASDVKTRGGVAEDVGRVSLRLAMKDVTLPTEPTTNNSITITRYRVEFKRADGRNTPGVDVPHAFDGGITVTVSGSTAVQATFTIVRVQAKFEPPLITLTGLGGAVAISTIADVTFYGRDQAGNEVSITGKIGVDFADWADED